MKTQKTLSKAFLRVTFFQKKKERTLLHMCDGKPKEAWQSYVLQPRNVIVMIDCVETTSQAKFHRDIIMAKWLMGVGPRCVVKNVILAPSSRPLVAVENGRFGRLSRRPDLASIFTFHVLNPNTIRKLFR